MGVERVVSLSLLGVYYDWTEGNRETIEESRREPRIIPAATIDPRRYYGGRREEAKLDGFFAIRLFPDIQGWPIDYAPFRLIVKLAGETGLPLIMPAATPGAATQIARNADAYKAQTLLCSVNYSTLSEALVLMRENDNIHICTDMLNTPDGVELVVDEFGPERLIFGSGFPKTYFSGPLLSVERASIPRSAKRKILRENILRMVGLR